MIERGGGRGDYLPAEPSLHFATFFNAFCSIFQATNRNDRFRAGDRRPLDGAPARRVEDGGAFRRNLDAGDRRISRRRKPGLDAEGGAPQEAARVPRQSRDAPPPGANLIKVFLLRTDGGAR
jgi:hypothetical protein